MGRFRIKLITGGTPLAFAAGCSYAGETDGAGIRYLFVVSAVRGGHWRHVGGLELTLQGGTGGTGCLEAAPHQFPVRPWGPNPEGS